MKTNVFFTSILVTSLFFASCTNDSDIEELQELEKLENIQSIHADEVTEEDT
ncbi:hypothetical protein NBT05_00040 [Aquimarina sp. ERC-38]|uniref:hypothetical protein n=1 Tax=Aquimarina sp. ERC-38 TaxID=2949996 RepID=UPI0022450EF9|nr:hypothetical protein [Aquimarina sp. ERC-38]UZO80892.1 hypothetical protein NBT05_00040 [Aquimarina sp. ERC-38]